MSFPSVAKIAAERGIAIHSAPVNVLSDILLEAVKTDCKEAVDYLHKLSHTAQDTGAAVQWSEDPNSILGKQLIRIHASDAVRPLVQMHVCHGQTLTFVNCCGGRVGGPKPKPNDDEITRFQIQSQMGPIAYADC
ncbi:MAG: hypothetical protein JWO43_216 [Candidatus Adlerbacteria bacterium]|nr:hypothetical protein [Candidatus Adlerbacteria bacterium]